VLQEEIRSIGERHFAAKTSFADDLPKYWGRWGCTSEVGRLRAVLLRRPGTEIEAVTDPSVPRWRAVMEPETARRQHDRMAEIYREHGVEVYYVSAMSPERPNAVFCRDLVAPAPEGVILARPAMAVRRGEERYVAETVAALGVPITKTINGTGTFEGADLLLVDRETAFLGWGNRTNEEGARQVIEELRWQGVTDITVVQVPYGVAHLDCMFALASADVAAVFPWLTPFIVCEKLLERGFRIVELQNPAEARFGYAVNFVALEPGTILMPSGNPESAEALANAGLKVLETDMSEIIKGMGAVHCCTAFLSRDPL
jgi:N-dimethylarginine dimethylaminohydrolase